MYPPRSIIPSSTVCVTVYRGGTLYYLYVRMSLLLTTRNIMFHHPVGLLLPSSSSSSLLLPCPKSLLFKVAKPNLVWNHHLSFPPTRHAHLIGTSRYSTSHTPCHYYFMTWIRSPSLSSPPSSLKSLYTDASRRGGGIIHRHLSSSSSTTTTTTTKSRYGHRPVPIGTFKDKYGRILLRRVRPCRRVNPSKTSTVSPSSSSSSSHNTSVYSSDMPLPRFHLLTATHLHVRFPGGIYLQIPRQLPKIPVAGPAIVPQPLKKKNLPPTTTDAVAAVTDASIPAAATTANSHSSNIITTTTTTSTSNASSIQPNATIQTIARPILTWFQENIPTLILNMGSLATLTAFTRSDILELRMLSITGSISSILYFSTRPPPRIYAPMIWSSIFVLTNLYMLYKIYMERQVGNFGRPTISMEELHAYQEFFAPYGVTPRQFGTLLSKATKTYYKKNSIVLHQQDVCNKVYLVLSGKTEARVVHHNTSPKATTTTTNTPTHNTPNATVIPPTSTTTTQDIPSSTTSTSSSTTTTMTNRDPTQTITPTPATTTTTISRRITAAGSVVGNKKLLVGGDAGAWIGEEIFLEEWSSRTALPLPTLPKKIVRKLKEKQLQDEQDEDNHILPSSIHYIKNTNHHPKIHTSLLEYCAVEDTVMLEWTHEDLIELLSQGSSDLRTAIPRAMTGAVVGKVVNMYLSNKQ